MRARTASLLSLAVSALIAPPFGWGARSDPASQIRASYHELFSALKANNVTRVCSHTNDPRKCRWQFAVAKAFIRSGKVADLYAAGEFRAISNDVDTWPIHVSADGGRATVRETCGGRAGCTASTATWVKIRGEWKLVV
jgi:hypothetical protein